MPPQLAAGCPAFPLSAHDLARWAKFARKGGIGKARAVVDRMAADDESLMFLEGDHIAVLLDLGEGIFLGCCEGVVGKFTGVDTEMGKLKRPVLMPRNSTGAPSNPLPSAPTPPPLRLTPQAPPAPVAPPTEAPRGTRLDLPDATTGDLEHPEGHQDVPNISRGGSTSSDGIVTREALPSGLGIVDAGIVIPAQHNIDEPFVAKPVSRPRPTPLFPRSSPVPIFPETASSTTPRIPYSDSPATSPNLPTLSRSPSPPPVTRPPSLDTSPPPSPPRSQTSLSIASTLSTASAHSVSSLPPNPPQRSKWSDVSLASSRLQKFSDGPSLSDYLANPNSHFSPASTLGPFATLSELESPTSPTFGMMLHGGGRGGHESDSSATSTEGDDILNPPTPGEETELFGGIYDSYRYSRTDAELEEHYFPRPRSPIRAESPTLAAPVTPLRYGAASELRTRLVAQRSASGSVGFGTPGSASSSATARPLLATSDSRDSVVVHGIPKLRDLFPRSSTDDSFTCISSLPSSSTDNSPKASPATSFSPSPPRDPKASPPIDGDVPVQRRLFQTYFSPPRGGADQPRSRLVIGLPDSPPSTQGSISPPRKGAPKGLMLGVPALAESPPMPAWRSSDSPTGANRRVEDDPFMPPPTPTGTLNNMADSFPLPPSAPSQPPTPTLAIHEAPSNPFRSYYDDPNPPPLGSWMPKLTIPSEEPNENVFQYALRPAPLPSSASSPSTPTFSTHSASSDAGSTLPPSPRSQTLPRSKSTSSLREGGPTKLRKSNNPRHKTSQSHIKAGGGGTDAVPAGWSSASDHQSVKSDDVPLPRNTGTNQIRKSSSTGSIFQFAKKRAAAAAAEEARLNAPRYGASVSSKDLEEETVRLHNTEFDLVKPLAALLLKDDDLGSDSSPGAHESRPSTSSSHGAFSPVYGRPSMSTRRRSGDVFDEHDEHDAAGGYGAYGRSRTSFSTFRAEVAFGPPDAKAADSYRARELTWIKTIGSMTPAAMRKSKKLQGFVRSGIPSSVRGRAWSFLCEVDREKVEGLYYSLCGLDPVPAYGVIESDIGRIFKDDPNFADGTTLREDLKSVLKALTRYSSDLGYECGLAWTAGLLLSHVPAEESFWIIVALVQRYGFKMYFSSGIESLAFEMQVFTVILDGFDSTLSKHLKEQGAGPESFLPSWFASLFATALPPASRLRCADLYFFDATFAFRIALSILQIARDRILACRSRIEILDIMRSQLPEDGSLEPASLMPTLFTLKLKDDKIKQARKKVEASMKLRKHVMG